MKIKNYIIILILSLTSITGYAGGITNAADLVAFASALNSGQDVSVWCNEQGEVCFENDIDMSKVKKFPTIKTFGGVLDCKGHSIKNWKSQNALIHEILEGGIVKNLRIDASCSMKAQNKSGEYFIGWIANINSGTIQNCENHAPVNHKSNYTESDLYIGGLVGSNRFIMYKCRNYGNISSVCVGSSWEGETIRIGGVAGGGSSKNLAAAVFARCENYGEISYVGDVPNDRVAGVVGEIFKVGLKVCVNYGNVRSQSNPGIDGQIGETWAAGVTAYGKYDIMCCDNWGNISSSGSNRTNVAGIISMPHVKMLIADCANYGALETKNDNPANMGGIAANIGREVHIINGINYGDIRFLGSSPNDPSCIGGVIGNAYTKRDAAKGFYLRRCANFGKIESQSGSNNYGNHNRAIHTGGIIGRAGGTETAKLRILDCYNKGEVKAVTGRRGEFAGGLFDADVKGDAFDNNMAVPSRITASGASIYGCVKDDSGSPVVGCVVSDGMQCVLTDSDGYYEMKSDMKDTRFVYVSIPDGYKLQSRKSIFQNFKRVPRYKEAVTADFVLEKRTEPTDKYTVIMIGDPQMRGLGVDNSGERFRDVVLPDIERYRQTAEGEFFAINLGDLIYNWMTGFDDYVDICAPVQYPIVNIIGNHDYCQGTLYETELGSPYYEEFITPTYYSFNIGKIHYVIVNDIIYNRTDPAQNYSSGLEDKQMHWLEEDLKYVPKDHIIYICGHAQLFKKKEGVGDVSYGKYNENYLRYTNLLKQYKRVYSWSGHYHQNYGFDYAGKSNYEDMGNISCISVARCNGTIRSNLELDNVGTPNGYMIVDVNGDDVRWSYKVVDHDRDYQMRAYSPLRTGDGYVKVNIWNYSPDYWSDVEWWENGQKIGIFEKHPELDPDYVELYNTRLSHLTGRAAAYATPEKSDYMFRIKPSEGVHSGEIRVKDNFGNIYTQKIEW